MERVMKAVFDTNILIDYLNGIEKARKELKRYRRKSISIITVLETLAGARDANEEAAIRRFLASFELVELTSAIAERTIRLRKDKHLKVPDAIVYATAQEHGTLLVTRNTKDFKKSWPDVRSPYRI